MRLIALLVLAAAIQTAAFAQKKTSDPEARNKRAVSVTESHGSGSAASPVKSNNSSAKNLAKIEQSGIQRMKATHTARSGSRAATPANTGAIQHKGKPVKFSYQRPKADKTASAVGSQTRSSPKGRH